MYIPEKTEMTPFSATYVDFENNEGGYFFLAMSFFRN